MPAIGQKRKYSQILRTITEWTCRSELYTLKTVPDPPGYSWRHSSAIQLAKGWGGIFCPVVRGRFYHTHSFNCAMMLDHTLQLLESWKWPTYTERIFSVRTSQVITKCILNDTPHKTNLEYLKWNTCVLTLNVWVFLST